MTSATITCLLMCLLFPGTTPVGLRHYKHISVSEGSTAVVGCPLDGIGEIQDLSIHWYKQLPSAAPMFLLSHVNDSSIRWFDASPQRYQSIRNGSHVHLLQITNVTVKDSALYWCLLTRNGSYPVWGGGSQLSVYGSKDARAPIVSLLSSQESLDESGLLYATCLATGFYPSVIEITWKFEEEPFQENVILGPFLEEGDNLYTVINIIGFTSQSRKNLSSVVCEVRHDSSKTLIHKELHHCYRNT